MKRVRYLVLMMTAFAVAIPEIAVSQATPDLTGTWKLNEEESDNPRESLQEGRKQESQSRRGGRFANRVRKKKVEKAKEALANFEEGSKELVIEQTADTVTFVYSDERKQVFPTDGSTVKLNGDTMREASAKWVDQQLVVTGQTKKGKDLVRTYELQKDGSRLVATLEVETDRGPFKVRRVYDKS